MDFEKVEILEKLDNLIWNKVKIKVISGNNNVFGCLSPEFRFKCTIAYHEGEASVDKLDDNKQ